MIDSSSQAGFTLLELMVAMALSVVIATICAMALGSGSDFYARSGLRQSKRVELRALEKMLKSEWQMRVGEFSLSQESVEFVTTLPRDTSGTSNVLKVKYECVPTENAEFSIVYTGRLLPKSKTDVPTSGTSEDTSKFEMKLVNRLKYCQFAAMSRNGSPQEKVNSVWVNRWSSEQSLPKLIRLKIGDMQGELPSYVFVAAPT